MAHAAHDLCHSHCSRVVMLSIVPSVVVSGRPHLFAPQKRINCEKNNIGYRWLNFGRRVSLPRLSLPLVFWSEVRSVVSSKVMVRGQFKRSVVSCQLFRSDCNGHWARITCCEATKIKSNLYRRLSLRSMRFKQSADLYFSSTLFEQT